MDLDRLTRDELVALLAQVLARLLPTGASFDTTGDRLLTIEQAADQLAVSKGWLYRRVQKLGLARKLSDNTLRVSSNALQSYIKSSARRGAK